MRVALLCVALAACNGNSADKVDGGGSGSGSDGGGGGDDAMIDADPNVRGRVTVRLVDRRGDPLAGMHVVFIDTDNTVTDLVSDASGTAGADVYPNASVTAIREQSTGTSYQLTTVLALNPGDTITLIASPGSVPQTDDTFTQGLVPLPAHHITATSKQGSTATYTTLSAHGLSVGDTVVVAGVNIAAYNGAWTVSGTPTATSFSANIGSGGQPDGTSGNAAKADRFTVSYSAYGGAASYEIYSPCGMTETVATSETILLRPGCSESTMDLVVAAKSAGGTLLAWADKTGVAFAPDGTTMITNAWQAPSPITATYGNAGTDVTDIALRRMAPYARGTAVETIGTVTGGAATLMMNASKPATAVMQSRLTCPSGGGCVSNMSAQTITQVVDGTSATYALDINANVLPWIEATWQPTTTTMDVTVTGSASYDLFHAALKYTRGQVSQIIFTWRVFGPTAGTFQFPTLPATVPGDPTIRVNDPQASYVVNVCDSDVVNGYRDAISNVYEVYNTCLASSAEDTVRYGGTLNRLSQSK